VNTMRSLLMRVVAVYSRARACYCSCSSAQCTAASALRCCSLLLLLLLLLLGCIWTDRQAEWDAFLPPTPPN